MDSDLKKKGILVVDDERGPRETLRYLLVSSGYRSIHVAASGPDGLKHLETFGSAIYLVLLDVRMPGMTGIEFFQRVAASHPHPVGVVVVTGYPSPETRQAFAGLATETAMALDYVAKPFEATDVLRSVARSLDTVHQRRQGTPLA